MIEYKPLGQYKYRLEKPYTYATGITGYSVRATYITLTKKGQLTINKGYAWDGASGPMYDADWIMRASLVHDVLYQLIREKRIDVKEKNKADKLLLKLSLEDGGKPCIVKIVYWAVNKFGVLFGKLR